MKDKREKVDAIKEEIKSGRTDLHPVEHAEACREIEIFSGKEADRQEKTNDALGTKRDKR